MTKKEKETVKKENKKNKYCNIWIYTIAGLLIISVTVNIWLVLQNSETLPPENIILCQHDWDCSEGKWCCAYNECTDYYTLEECRSRTWGRGYNWGGKTDCLTAEDCKKRDGWHMQ